MADVSAEFVENCGFELLRTGYTPPDGYRLLQIGEVVQKDDLFLAVNGEHWPAKRIGETVNNNRYLRRIEVEQAEPQPEPQPEQEPLPEPVPEPVQVREGRWRTKAGEIVSVSAMPTDHDDFSDAYPWWDGDVTTWANNGSFFSSHSAEKDLVEYLGPLEPQLESQPEAVPVQVCEGRWRTRGGDIRNVTPTPAGDGREHRFPWWDAQYRQTWAEDGRYHVRGESPLDLVEYLGPIEPQLEAGPEPQSEPQAEPQPQPEPQPPVPQDADQMIRLLSEANHNHVAMIGRLQAAINERAELGGADQTRAELQARIRSLEIMTDAQAETIARLQSEAHELNMEIGGLQGDLSRRQARIRDLETMHAEAAQAVVRADKANDKLREQLDAATAELQKRHPDHVGRAISTEEWMDQFARDASVSRLQADRNDLAGKVIVLREQLQQANDRLAFLETLQPIAAACHTAQTMVRDMLGHMRCLLALQHTTDRRDSCTLLESILEVFDEAECDEDEDDGVTCTTDTSEAGQG